MDVSVIICTYNRSGSLSLTLEGLCRQSAPPTLTWELILVDNNSTDDTARVCELFKPKLPIHYLFENQQGLGAARNRGISVARGDLILFTDDDVDVHPHWLATIGKAVQRHPEVSYCGGKILPKWEAAPPRWLLEHAGSILRGVAMSFDIGDRERIVSTGDDAFFGANVGFRRQLFHPGQKFREDLGCTSNQPLAGDETKLIEALKMQGHRGLYIPEAVVYHRNPRERMTERYVRRWFKGSGISKVRLGEIADSQRKLLGAPRYLWRKFAAAVCVYLLTRYRRPASIWLPAEISMAETWGVICEYRRQTRLRKRSVVGSQPRNRRNGSHASAE